MKYTAYIPAWSVHIEAKNDKEALMIATRTFEDHMDNDPEMGQIIIEKIHTNQVIRKHD
jgi:hypothetical protein